MPDRPARTHPTPIPRQLYSFCSRPEQRATLVHLRIREWIMRRASFYLFVLSLAGISAKGHAQLPMPGCPGVETLLSQTGALQLSDAQVVRLAAIARRAEDRHRALRTRLDSLRPRRGPGDSTARGRGERMPGMDLFERERDATHNDLRDALTVLSPDQQARAWEMMAGRRALGRGGPMPRSGIRPPMRREESPSPQRRPGDQDT